MRLFTGSPLPMLPCTFSRACVEAGGASWQAGLWTARTCQHIHSSACSQDKDEDAAASLPDDSSSSSLPDDSSSSPSPTAAGSPAAGPVHARHISLNDPELNIRLTYNKNFTMDADRRYAIGHINDLQRKTRLELQKALAAQRLSLRDAAAAAPGSKQLPLREQMQTRLSELLQACRSR